MVNKSNSVRECNVFKIYQIPKIGKFLTYYFTFCFSVLLIIFTIKAQAASDQQIFIIESYPPPGPILKCLATEEERWHKIKKTDSQFFSTKMY